MKGLNVCCCLGAFIGLAMVGVIFGIFAVKKSASDMTELRQVHVVFSHGERTPSREEVALYPRSEYRHERYHPHGHNALTNSGKMTSFKTGERLREAYGAFVGPTYRHTEFRMRAADTDVAKTSALLLAAGLWPVPEGQTWVDLRWQPIPYRNAAFDKDYLLFEHNCRRYAEEKARVTELFSRNVSPYYHDLFDRLKNFTGRPITEPHEVLLLTNLLDAQVEFNENVDMEYPDWYIDMRDSLLDVVNLEYNIMFQNTLMQRLSAGALLKNILSDSKTLVENDKKGKDSIKMYAYSGTISNIVSILAAIESEVIDLPNPGSMIVIELHHKPILRTYYFKVKYWSDNSAESRALEILSDKEALPLQNFEDVLRDILCDDWVEECKAVKN